MPDPIYYINGPDTDEQRQYAETKLRLQGCGSCVHEERGTGVICSLGYRGQAPGAISLHIDTRTPVEAI